MLIAALWLACQPKSEPSPAAHDQAPVEASAPAPVPAPPSEAPPPPTKSADPPCGGFAGFQCPEDRACIDDPTDSCEPGRGADCMGICLVCDDPRLTAARRYVGTPEQCPVMKFTCNDGEQYFADACGCGCAPSIR